MTQALKHVQRYASALGNGAITNLESASETITSAKRVRCYLLFMFLFVPFVINYITHRFQRMKRNSQLRKPLQSLLQIFGTALFLHFPFNLTLKETSKSRMPYSPNDLMKMKRRLFLRRYTTCIQ